MQADLDNGYTRIANEILEALACLDLSGREFRVAITIMRKTYGFQKKLDWIAREQLAEITGISKENCSRIVGDLCDRKIILKEGNGYTKKLGINTKISEWFSVQENVNSNTKQNVESDTTDLPKQHSVESDIVLNPTLNNVESDTARVESDTRDPQKRQPQKKENNTKEISKERFEILWKSFDGRFGDKGSKQQAQIEFKKINPDETLFTEMIQAIDYQHRLKEVKTNTGQFCANFKHVERWLKKREWTNDDAIHSQGIPKIIHAAQDRSWAEDGVTQ
jgi:phage replication O-like protein O